jgi:hypothetical protein
MPLDPHEQGSARRRAAIALSAETADRVAHHPLDMNHFLK